MSTSTVELFTDMARHEELVARRALVAAAPSESDFTAGWHAATADHARYVARCLRREAAYAQRDIDWEDPDDRVLVKLLTYSTRALLDRRRAAA